jgi:hypothetical protein
MPAQAVDHYDTILAYLRDKYWNAADGTWDVEALREMRDAAFAAATRVITITSSSSEAGGAAAGEITFDRMTLVAALNDLLAEADPAAAPPVRSRGIQVVFSNRKSST